MPRWKALLDPVLANRIVQGRQLQDVTLAAATPTIVYHGLGRVPSGWFLTDLDASSIVNRSGPMTDSTLVLAASANCTVSLWVY